MFCFLDWNKDFKPGPYPKTEEERAAAAKKYGLQRHEYKPYPDDGKCYQPLSQLKFRALKRKFWNWCDLIYEMFSFWTFTGAGIGDYPHLPDVPVEQRDIYYPYDLPDQRRNYGEAVSDSNEFSGH